MITNPYVGQRVVLLDKNVFKELRGQPATIVNIFDDQFSVNIRIVFDVDPTTKYGATLNALTDINDPEVAKFIDSQKREEFALRYL